MRPVCYAQRLLNPFRGVMNIIEYQGAEAVTMDGFHWDIYVRDMALVEDLANSRKVQTSDIRYGSWSPKQGLKRGALYPSEDFKQLERLGAIVYEYLLQHHTEVPFVLRDRYELWLLDSEDQPLALLDSAIDVESVDDDGHIEWRPGRECCKTFTTPLWEEFAQQGDSVNAGDRLARLINEQAGREPGAQWFLRRQDGAAQGYAGPGLKQALVGRKLPAQAFPQMFIKLFRDKRLPAGLLDAYFDWQAPYLLLLHHLDDTQRIHYERQAARRATVLDKHHRLYPKIIDQEVIKAARVEALLRANEAGTEEEDTTMATYYIELNVTRTN